MNKRKVRQAAYKSVVKGRKTHQETFDELEKNSSLSKAELAKEIARFPSAEKQERTQVLRFVFIGLLLVVIILRGLGVIVMSMELNFNPAVMLLMIALGIVVPVIGIIGALTGRVQFYQTVGILFIYSIFKTFTQKNYSFDVIEMVVLVPFVLAIILAFLIPAKLKVNYRVEKVNHKDEKGNVVSSEKYFFESTKFTSNEDLLDEDIS